MKSFVVLASALLLASAGVAAEKTTTITTTTTSSSTSASTMTSSTALAPNTLAFNFVGLSQGKANVYFDIGGLSERVTPALSFRSYSNQEERKALKGKGTVDRSLATLGASIAVLKGEGKALLVNPYLFFGTEKDALNTSNNSGVGARVVGQINLNKSVGLQLGVDGNGMEGDFKGDIYAGVSFAL